MNNVWLTQNLLDSIIAEIESFAPLETGGAFFGYHAENNDIVITDLIASGPDAIHTKSSFEPDQVYQLTLMEDLFFKSNGKLTYLGDWHSHPTSSPALSRKDRKTLLNIALSESAKCNKPLMIIFGSQPEKWTVNVVRYTSGKMYFGPFHKCKYHQLNLIVD